MGVKYLQTYIKNYCPGDVCYMVDLKTLANEYRETYNKEAVIVIDAYACIHKIYNLDFVCGGEYTEFVNCITSFIQQFTALGIKLAFFFDGHVQEAKRREWVKRRLDRMEKVQRSIDALKRDGSIGSMNPWDIVLPEGLGYVMAHVIRKNQCMIQRSMKECDEEIALYAKNNNCLAILADDSDFVIYQCGAQYLLSLSKLDMRTMKTWAYDSSALSRYLRLNTKDLPLLASLMGNDFLSYENDLSFFHHQLTGVSGASVSYLVPKLVEYIKKLRPNNRLLQVAMDVFGKPEKEEIFKQSLRSYNPTEVGNDKSGIGSVVLAARKHNTEMTLPGFIHNVIEYSVYESGNIFEGYNDPKMPPSAIVLRKMRQRMYGILQICSDHPDSKLVVNEWCLSGPHSLHGAKAVPAIIPPFQAPASLIDLWKLNSNDLIESKFKLLSWISSKHLSSKNTNLREFPCKLIGSICALCYLYHDAKILDELEVMILASVIIDTQAMNSQDLSSIMVHNVNIRGVYIATLFTRTVTHIFIANSVCGKAVEDEWMLHHQVFNGKLFQDAYKSAVFTKSPPHPKKGSLHHFNLLCRAILS